MTKTTLIPFPIRENDPCNVGKIFNLDIITLTALLYKIELMGYIKVVRTADIMPDTHFTASINAIESWKADYPDTYKQFLSELNSPIDNFILSLKEYNVEAYEKFVELYRKRI